MFCDVYFRKYITPEEITIFTNNCDSNKNGKKGNGRITFLVFSLTEINSPQLWGIRSFKSSISSSLIALLGSKLPSTFTSYLPSVCMFRLVCSHALLFLILPIPNQPNQRRLGIITPHSKYTHYFHLLLFDGNWPLSTVDTHAGMPLISLLQYAPSWPIRSKRDIRFKFVGRLCKHSRYSKHEQGHRKT